jgi:hypothetical protein
MKALVAILRRVLRPLRSGIDTRYPVAANRTSQTYHHAPADLLVFFLHQRVLVRFILQQAKSFLSKPGRWRSRFFTPLVRRLVVSLLHFFLVFYFRSILLGP